LKVQLTRPTFQCITHTSSVAGRGGGAGMEPMRWAAQAEG
jgi:hypothetical protein